MSLGRLHVVTDSVMMAAAALAGGAPVIQVRAKGGTDRELYDLCERIGRLCAAAGAQCIVNDRPDVALAVGAAGTHLGATDLPLAAARRVAGPLHELGGTARTPDAGRRLVSEGASYLGVGPAYATTTKTGLPAAIGAAGIGAVAAAVDVPVVAIGGVTLARIPELLAAGAYGVAVVGAVAAAADPAAATRALLAALADTGERAMTQQARR